MPAGCFRGSVLGVGETDSPMEPNKLAYCFTGRIQRPPGARGGMCTLFHILSGPVGSTQQLRPGFFFGTSLEYFN